MNGIRIYAPLTLTLTLSACAVPMVSYDKLEVSKPVDRSLVKADLEGRPKFKLASSMVVIKAETKDEKTSLKISSVPIEEARNVTYAILDASSPGIKTNLKIKNRDNSMLLESVTTALEDNRLKLIQGIGGVIGAVVGFNKSADEKLPSNFSATIDLRRYLNEGGHEKPDRVTLSDKDISMYKLPSLQEYVVSKLEIGPVPADATPRNAYPTTSEQRALIYSACRDLDIVVSINEMKFAGTVKIADPNYLQTVAIPSKGSITMHSECGVTVASEPVQTTSPTDLIQEIIKQIKTVTGG